MFRGYEVEARQPAWLSQPQAPASPTRMRAAGGGEPEPRADDGGPGARDGLDPAPLVDRPVRAKRPAQDMAPSPSEGKSQAGAAGMSDPQSHTPAKRPYIPSNEVLFEADYDTTHWEHPLTLTGEDEPACGPGAVPVPWTALQADALLAQLDTGDDALLLRRIQAVLAQDRFSRRALPADPKRPDSMAMSDHTTLGEALAKRWNGDRMSAKRLDLLAHAVSHQAGLTLKDDAGDLEQAAFLRGVFSAAPGGEKCQDWVRRILDQGFSEAHAAHPAYPHVGRGTMRLLLRALGEGAQGKEMVPLILDLALVPRGNARASDARRHWSGADLRVAVAMARGALYKELTVQPPLLHWVARASQFSGDELSFLAAGISTRVPLKADLPGDAAAPQAAAPGRIHPSVLSRLGRTFLAATALDDAKLASVCLGLAYGNVYPNRSPQEQRLVDSLLPRERYQLGQAVGWLAQTADDSRAVTVRLGQSLARWVKEDPVWEVSAAQRKVWQEARLIVLTGYLATAAHGCDPQAVEVFVTLLAEVRSRLYGGGAWSPDSARKFLSSILAPAPAQPASEEDWQRVRQYNAALQMLTAVPMPSPSLVGEAQAATRDGH